MNSDETDKKQQFVSGFIRVDLWHFSFSGLGNRPTQFSRTGKKSNVCTTERDRGRSPDRLLSAEDTFSASSELCGSESFSSAFFIRAYSCHSWLKMKTR